MPTNFAELVPAPSPSDINTGSTSPGNATLIRLLGSPRLCDVELRVMRWMLRFDRSL